MWLLFFSSLFVSGLFVSGLGWGVDLCLNLLDNGTDLLHHLIAAVQLLGLHVDHVGLQSAGGCAPCLTGGVEVVGSLVGVISGCGGLECGGELLELLPCLLTFGVQTLLDAGCHHCDDGEGNEYFLHDVLNFD